MEDNNVKAPRKLLKLDRRFLLGVIVGLIVIAIGIGVTAASGVVDDDETGGEIENIAPGALNITDTQAREAVEAAYPNATIQSLDLDTQSDGTLVYDVELDNGQEIMVSARTGEVLGAEADDDDASGSEDGED